MKALTRNMPRVTPPFWLTSMVAAAVGAALMVAFINTLHQNVRHGEEFRQAQRVSNVRHTMGTVAKMAPRSQAPQLGTLMSPTFQR